MRHYDPRGAKARPFVDRHRRHAPGDFIDRASAQGCVSRHCLRGSWHTEGSGKRTRPGPARQVPVSVVGGVIGRCAPLWGKKKGADGGIDGILFFRSDRDKTEKVLVSVKGGENVGVGMVRDLIAV